MLPGAVNSGSEGRAGVCRWILTSKQEKSRTPGQKLVNSAGPQKASILKLSIWLYSSDLFR